MPETESTTLTSKVAAVKVVKGSHLECSGIKNTDSGLCAAATRSLPVTTIMCLLKTTSGRLPLPKDCKSQFFMVRVATAVSSLPLRAILITRVDAGSKSATTAAARIGSTDVKNFMRRCP
jgi:hypothetical protein